MFMKRGHMYRGENFGPKKERMRGVRYRYSDGGETTEEGYTDGGIPSTDR
jgi:hypothetical protein